MMWPFNRRPSKESLEDHAWVTAGEFRFKIRRINPLLDFPADKVPTVFSSTPQKKRPKAANTHDQQRRDMEQMASVIRAGVVEPNLSRNKKNGEDRLSVEDLFRWPEVAATLYAEIIAHSIKRHRGIRGFLEWSQTRRSLLMPLLNGTVSAPQPSSSEKGQANS